jgi:hypothetical protein
MIQFLNHNAQNVPHVPQSNKTLVFVNESGKICTKDAQGNISIIGKSNNTGYRTPRLSELVSGKATYFIHALTGTVTQHFELHSKWTSANNKLNNLVRSRTDFNIPSFAPLYDVMLKQWLQESGISTGIINSILGYCQNTAVQIYLEQNIPSQDYFILTDVDTTKRHAHDLCIDVLLNLAKHFDQTTELINIIPKNNLAYFNYDVNATTTGTEDDYPSEFTTGGKFATPEQKAFLGKIIVAMVDVLNQLYDATDFINIPNTTILAGNRDTAHIGDIFSILMI